MSHESEEQQHNDTDKLNALEKLLREYGRDLQEIKLAVAGDTGLGIDGLGKRVTSLEKWKTKFNLKVASFSGLAGGLTFGGLEGIKALLEALAHHKP